MLSVERELLIIEKLKHYGKVMVNDLAADLEVAAMTIRRDLLRLEQRGLLQRVHGGAVQLNGLTNEKAFVEKRLIHPEEKRLIAKEALKLVSEGETVLLDAGTTTFELAVLFGEMRGIDVVTNDLQVAQQLCSTAGKLFFIGGEIEKNIARSTGAKAFQFLSDVHVDTVFLGVSAISDDFVLCSHSFENAELKLAMLRCGSKKVLLADKSKFGIKAFAQIGPLSLIDILVTDKAFDDREMKYLETHGVTLCQVVPKPI